MKLNDFFDDVSQPRHIEMLSKWANVAEEFCCDNLMDDPLKIRNTIGYTKRNQLKLKQFPTSFERSKRLVFVSDSYLVIDFKARVLKTV